MSFGEDNSPIRRHRACGASHSTFSSWNLCDLFFVFPYLVTKFPDHETKGRLLRMKWLRWAGTEGILSGIDPEVGITIIAGPSDESAIDSCGSWKPSGR
jgi:hypothetical protein